MKVPLRVPPATTEPRAAALPSDGRPLTLGEVLCALIDERHSSWREVAARAEPWCDRASVYRVLNGSTRNPQVTTLAAICRALDVRPQEVFERAGLWSAENGPKDARHAELRALWVSLGCLPDRERMRIIEVVRALLGAHRAQQQQQQQQEASRR